jgi:hypothetical protein
MDDPDWPGLAYLPRSLRNICQATQPRRSHVPARVICKAANKATAPAIQTG